MDFTGLAVSDFGDFDDVFEVVLRDVARLALADGHVSALGEMIGHARADEHEDNAEVGHDVPGMPPTLPDADDAAEDQIYQQDGADPVAAGEGEPDGLAVDFRQQENRAPVGGEILVECRIKAVIDLFEGGEPGQQAKQQQGDGRESESGEHVEDSGRQRAGDGSAGGRRVRDFHG